MCNSLARWWQQSVTQSSGSHSSKCRLFPLVASGLHDPGTCDVCVSDIYEAFLGESCQVTRQSTKWHRVIRRSKHALKGLIKYRWHDITLWRMHPVWTDGISLKHRRKYDELTAQQEAWTQMRRVRLLMNEPLMFYTSKRSSYTHPSPRGSFRPAYHLVPVHLVIDNGPLSADKGDITWSQQHCSPPILLHISLFPFRGLTVLRCTEGAD